MKQLTIILTISTLFTSGWLMGIKYGYNYPFWMPLLAGALGTLILLTLKE